jgi:hypothetical protein
MRPDDSMGAKICPADWRGTERLVVVQFEESFGGIHRTDAKPTSCGTSGLASSNSSRRISRPGPSFWWEDCRAPRHAAAVSQRRVCCTAGLLFRIVDQPWPMGRSGIRARPRQNRHGRTGDHAPQRSLLLERRTSRLAFQPLTVPRGATRNPAGLAGCATLGQCHRLIRLAVQCSTGTIR